MKRLSWIIVFSFVLTTVQAQGFSDYRKQFWDQLTATCQPGLRWEKTVTELPEGESPKVETKVFDLDCIHGTAKAGSQSIPLQSEEFGHLFECAYDNPYFAPYMDLVQANGSILATVKPGQEDDSKLRIQRFELNPHTGKLLRAEAHIVKTSPLYDLEVHINVWFDEAGHYDHHEVETQTDVWLGGSMHSIIKARLLK
jgi:hypothetical protein